MYQNPGMRGVCYILLNPMILLRGRWMRKEKGRGFFCLLFLQDVKAMIVEPVENRFYDLPSFFSQAASILVTSSSISQGLVR